jgi:hypothetical protein
VFASPLVHAYDAWIDFVLPTEGPGSEHTLEKYGRCPDCGDGKDRPLAPSPGLGHGCRLFKEAYERDPLVLSVPAHHGDTATGRHAADLAFVEANGPDVVLRHCEADLRRLERHRPVPADGWGDGRIVCELEWGSGDGWIAPWPCEDARDIAAAYAVSLSTPPSTPEEPT